jgi:hypothetical protein
VTFALLGNEYENNDEVKDIWKWHVSQDGSLLLPSGQ